MPPVLGMVIKLDLIHIEMLLSQQSDAEIKNTFIGENEYPQDFTDPFFLRGLYKATARWPFFAQMSPACLQLQIAGMPFLKPSAASGKDVPRSI